MTGSVFDFSTTPASNTAAPPDGIEGNDAPSTIDDTFRDLMARGKSAVLAVTSAGTNTITATYAPVPAAYVSGMILFFKAGGTNTATSTFNANGLGAKTVKIIASAGTQALQGGEIITGGFYAVQYDGTDMILLNPTPQEGSWTPVIAGLSTAGTQTYSTQVGRYIRDRNLVTVWCTVTMTAVDGTTAGNLIVTGLPFTSSNVSGLVYSGNVAHWKFDLTAGNTQVGVRVDANQARLNLAQNGDNASVTALTSANLLADTTLVASVTYRIG